jgi:hypothetical protein
MTSAGNLPSAYTLNVKLRLLPPIIQCYKSEGKYFSDSDSACMLFTHKLTVKVTDLFKVTLYPAGSDFFLMGFT